MFILYKRNEKQKRWLIKNPKEDFHMQYGVIPKSKLKKGSFSLHGHDFVVIPASVVDMKLKRKAQIITQKDIGYIIGYCCLGKESVVLESGAGSGGATVALARVCKKVYSVEIEKENIAIVKENLQKLSIKNVTLKEGDIYEKAPIKTADVFLLDVPEPWRAYKTMKSVKVGGHIVAYTPSITQAAEFVNNLPKEFLHEKTVELMDRNWKIKGKAVRPVNAAIGHTAFLTFVRRLC
ncbi:MAG: methyltransferase domain-containing protein [Candidatus Woesearchaeota archaeon]|nr:methyltransferase domain-containing protein [Candidatus Woesearchaeota archaeon]